VVAPGQNGDKPGRPGTQAPFPHLLFNRLQEILDFVVVKADTALGLIGHSQGNMRTKGAATL
jgi:hypothetical protein